MQCGGLSGSRVADVISIAKSEGITTAAAADRIAESRLKAARSSPDKRKSSLG